jgi:hypothetical protein
MQSHMIPITRKKTRCGGRGTASGMALPGRAAAATHRLADASARQFVSSSICQLVMHL